MALSVGCSSDAAENTTSLAATGPSSTVTSSTVGVASTTGPASTTGTAAGGPTSSAGSLGSDVTNVGAATSTGSQTGATTTTLSSGTQSAGTATATAGISGTTATPGPNTTGGAGGSGSVTGSSTTGQVADVVPSSGCGQTPSLQDSPSTNTFNYNTLTSGGVERRYILRLPENYDSAHPYRLILGFHGATDSATNVAGNPAFFGLYELSEGSTIFIAPEAVEGIWAADADTVFVDDLLEQVTAELCIDTTRIVAQGFSQGAAMTRALACARPDVFRAAVAHSAGGLALPSECEPIPYLGSLGTRESSGNGQAGQTDFFAMAAGCTIETLPTAPAGGHVCTDYTGCSEGNPVRWCSFDAGHTPLPNDSAQNASWVPEEVWGFLSQVW